MVFRNLQAGIPGNYRYQHRVAESIIWVWHLERYHGKLMLSSLIREGGFLHFYPNKGDGWRKINHLLSKEIEQQVRVMLLE